MSTNKMHVLEVHTIIELDQVVDNYIDTTHTPDGFAVRLRIEVSPDSMPEHDRVALEACADHIAELRREMGKRKQDAALERAAA